MPRVASIVIVATLLSLAATMAWVPRNTSWATYELQDGTPALIEVETKPTLFYGWIWQHQQMDIAPGNAVRGVDVTYPVAWPVIIIEQCIILVIGGGALSVVIRRHRHRRASGHQRPVSSI